MLPAGVYAPIPTPFDESGEVSPRRLRAAVTRWLRSPLTGLVVLGSSGEAPLLDEDESERVIAAARDAIPSGTNTRAQIADLVAAGGPSFHVFAGSSSSFYAARCVGATGGILALGCVVPEACVRLHASTGAGAHDEAVALQRRLMPLARLLGNRYGVA